MNRDGWQYIPNPWYPNQTAPFFQTITDSFSVGMGMVAIMDNQSGISSVMVLLLSEPNRTEITKLRIYPLYIYNQFSYLLVFTAPLDWGFQEGKKKKRRESEGEI